MLNHNPFYHKVVRNTTAAFGSLFNDIEIVRVSPDTTKTQRVKVPLMYASADKAFERRNSDPTLNYNMQGIFPRLAFYLVGMSYDPERRTIPVQYASKDNSFLYSPVPYNLDFDLYLATANIEDGLQIIEQIVPFFAPEFTLKTNAVDGIDLHYNVPIILNSVSYIDPAQDSSFADFRIIEWTLNFTAKTYFPGPTQTRNEIKNTKIKMFDRLPFSDDDNRLQTNIANVIPESADESDPHTIVEKIEINVNQRQ